MKTLSRIYFIAFCFGAVFAGKAQNMEALDQQYGFLGYSFEAHVDSVQGLRMQDRYLKKQRYVPANGPLTLLDVELSKVFFLFYEGRLHSVMIRTEGAEESERALEALNMLYGPGKQDAMAPRYNWQGDRTTIFYDQNLLTKNAEIVVESIPMQKEFNKKWRIQR